MEIAIDEDGKGLDVKAIAVGEAVQKGRTKRHRYPTLSEARPTIGNGSFAHLSPVRPIPALAPRLIRHSRRFRTMKHGQPVTMKYLAEVAGVNPGLVRKYVMVLRALASDSDLIDAQGGSMP